MLGLSSEESPGAEGLGIIPLKVTKLPANMTVPQQGWNFVQPNSDCKFLQSGYAYFSNSFKFDVQPVGWSSALSNYGGQYIAAIEKGAVLATQFHPELSGPWGLQLLKRWVLQSSTDNSIAMPVSFKMTQEMPLSYSNFFTKFFVFVSFLSVLNKQKLFF